MLKKCAALFVILGSLSVQLLIPWLGQIPCQTMAGVIAFLWLFFGSFPALLAALLAGFCLDMLSFNTPFGLFLFSYTLATFLACRMSRYSFQNPFVTYLLFTTLIAVFAPLFELGIMMLRYHRTLLALPLIVENVILPIFLDLLSAAFFGSLALSFLKKKKALKII